MPELPNNPTPAKRRPRPQRSGRNNKKSPDRLRPIGGPSIGTAGWSCVGLVPSSLVSARPVLAAFRINPVAPRLKPATTRLAALTATPVLIRSQPMTEAPH